MFSNPTAGTSRPPSRVTLVSVSDPRVSEGKKVYFAAHFKAGLLGKPVGRTFWSDTADDGTPTWERASPDDLRAMIGADLTGEVEVVAVEIESEEFVNERTGEVHVVSSRSVVRFADESVEQATRRSGSQVRKATVLPAAQALAIHGDGYAGDGGQLAPGVPA